MIRGDITITSSRTIIFFHNKNAHRHRSVKLLISNGHFSRAQSRLGFVGISYVQWILSRILNVKLL